MTNKYLHLIVFDLIYVAAIASMIWLASPVMIGGGWVYFIIIGLLIGLYVGYFKSLVKPILQLAVFTLCLAGFNLVLQYEIINGFSIEIVACMVLAVFIIGNITISVLYYPFRLIQTQGENITKEERKIRKHVFSNFARGHILISGLSVSAIIAAFQFSNKYVLMNVAYLLPVYIIASTLYVHFSIKDVSNDYLRYFINEAAVNDVNMLMASSVKFLWLPLIVGIIIGLGIEMNRKQYAIFVLSYIALAAVVLSICSIWKRISICSGYRNNLNDIPVVIDEFSDTLKHTILMTMLCIGNVIMIMLLVVFER